MGATVEDLVDGLERFLASSVPDLQFEGDVVDPDQQRAELHADRHFVILLELIVAHPMHQARLADAAVPDHDQLEKEVLLERRRPSSLRRDDLVRKRLQR